MLAVFHPLTDGDILNTATLVKVVFVAGKPIIAKSYFRKEYERAREKISGAY